VPVVPNKLPVRKKGDAVHEAVFSLTTLTTDDSDDFFEASQVRYRSMLFNFIFHILF